MYCIVPQGQYNAVVDLTAPQYALPISGNSTVTKLKYDWTSRCGFQELYAIQEWAAKQFTVSAMPAAML